MQDGQVKRGVSITKLVVLAVFVIIAIAGGLAYKQYRAGVERRPETYGASFMQLLTEKDGSTTYNMFTDSAKKRTTQDDWNAWVVFAFDKYDGGEPKLIGKNTVPDPGHLYSKNDEVVRMHYEVKNHGVTGQIDLILAADGDSWKVGEVGLIK